MRPFVTFSAVGKTARAGEKETLESESSLEPQVAIYDADNSGSSTDVTPLKAEKVFKRKEKPARKRKSTQESSKVIEWPEVYNQERKVEQKKRRKTQRVIKSCLLKSTWGLPPLSLPPRNSVHPASISVSLCLHLCQQSPYILPPLYLQGKLLR